MMTNKEILDIALKQSAIDTNCKPKDFLKNENVIVEFRLGADARTYYKEPIACNLVSYGNNIVASVKDEYRDIVAEYIEKYEFYYCFETPNMHWLNDRLSAKGQKMLLME
ncbi:MAG: hypothetical protein PHN80_03325 [Hespellia sp.]|nr:hypothetical protein [Hespellia sp.]